ncbi:hypothetical protein NQ314_009607 [Rhamnusium bicolor]|uniref:adenylate cyclase n=1 Tax=Rhamnusium bicolor TaxID=1586634 RepID=A0AAV8XYK4_9CUCU|nr:hypothetical protein NQ314_009607 [Rhamnusium bicolor]
MDVKKISSISLKSLSGLSEGSIDEESSPELENYDEKKWRLSHLKSQFESLELHKLFEVYTDKINHGYFSLFLILQAVLSITHFLLLVCVITYQDKISSEVVYLICINGLGIYFRFMNEIVIRRSFLDRRECIMSTFQLRHEKEQEEQLMSSIIPNNMINKVKENYIETTKYFITNKKITQKESVRKFGVIRIKFLGDCYYCVAGLPPYPAPNHAEACVDLGLSMISIIASIRRKRNLNINMRIGVHTGKIISGIIGAVKYQFDVWSKDVDIANKMESEGCPGMVHITNKTKELLEKPYSITPTDNGETVQQFKQNNLQTYLVTPTENKIETRNQNSNGDIPNQPRPSIFKKQRPAGNNGAILLTYLQNAASQGTDDDKQDYNNIHTTIERNNKINISTIEENENSNDRLYSKRRLSNSPYRNSKLLDERRSTADIKRRTAFMNNNIKRYAERATAVNQEMEKTIDDISFSKYEQYVKIKDINSFFLLFKKRNIELGYIKIPDPLFKYYLLTAVFLILCVYLIQNLTLLHWGWTTWPFLATEVLIIFVLLPLSWTQFLWSRFVSNFSDILPSNRLIYFLCKTSQAIKDKFIVRLTIYTIIYILFCVCVLIELHMTETCILTVIMTFLFLRIFIWIKLLFALITISVYSYFVMNFTNGFWADSETFNHGLTPQAAHILSVVFITLTLHAVDRQTDYMNRLDHLLNEKLKSEQEEANIIQIVNKNLLLNILPKHVGMYIFRLAEKRKIFKLFKNIISFLFVIVDSTCLISDTV